MIPVVILLAIVILSMLGIWYYMYRFEQGERLTGATETNMDAAIHSLEEFEKVMERFPDLQRLAGGTHYDTYVIPGLKVTKSILAETGEVQMCTTMTPQALAVTEDYLLITAYCHEHLHHSVIYMIDKESHAFLKEIILPDRTHAGGLSFDPVHRMVWVSGYQHKKAYANAYRLEDMEAYRLDEARSPLSYAYEEPLKELKRNSFMTYKEGCLYAGYFAMGGESVFEKYRIQADGSLALYEEHLSAQEEKSRERTRPVSEGQALISHEVQGIAFHREKLMVCKSYGMKPSKVLVMKGNEIEDGIYDFRDKNAAAVYTLPDRLECICYADGKVYLLFESASAAYRHRTYWAMDRVIAMEAE